MKLLNTWSLDMNETLLWSMLGIVVAICLVVTVMELIGIAQSCQCVSL